MADPHATSLPAYIAVEGPIGVGKTSLTHKLANAFNYETVLEAAADNPFLDRFYQNRRQAALPTQLFFLFDRMRQINELRQNDLFNEVRVADFLLEKDRLFAEINLDKDELALYEQVYQHVAIDAPTPDLVIYLQAPTEVLLSRIETRGIAAEANIEPAYLDTLVNAYLAFFHFYDASPLLIVNAAEVDLINDEEEFDHLVRALAKVQSGRHYYNPKQTMI